VGRLAFAALVGTLVAGFPLLGARSLRLTCVRSPSGAGACTLVDSGPILPARRRTLADDEIVELAVREQSGAWAVVVTDLPGAETVVAERDDRAAAARLEQRLRSFARDRTAHGFAITTPASPLAWVLAGLAVAIALGLAAHALTGGARFRVEIDRQHDALRIVRTWLGFPRARSSARLADVVDVELERGPVGDALASARSPAEPGGRLVLVLRDGSRLPLSPSMLRGPAVLERSFAALRAALALPAGAPPPVAPAAFSGARRSWLRPWMIFAVVGIVGWSAMLGYLVVDAPAPNEGRLDLRADVRCRFQGMDLLPGGRVETGLPAGDYPIRVWDAKAPGHWSERTVRIRPGMTTVTRCSVP